MLAITPSPPLTPPTSPVEVRRRFRAVAPYTAGGRRTIVLATRPGRSVAAPCAGTSRFVGAVAGSRPVTTIDCARSGLRVTVGGAAPSVDAGALVARGARIGTASGPSLTLSVRRPGRGYVDPLPLLQARAPWPPPAVGLARWPGKTPGHLRAVPSTHLPVVRLNGSLHTVGPERAERVAPAEPDRWLGGIGAITGLAALGWAATRHRRIRISGPRPAAVRR